MKLSKFCAIAVSLSMLVPLIWTLASRSDQGEVYGSEAIEEQTSLDMDAIYLETLQAFVEAEGFGSDRISTPTFWNHIVALEEDTPFEVNLIGFVEDKKGRVYPSRQDFDKAQKRTEKIAEGISSKDRSSLGLHTFPGRWPQESLVEPESIPGGAEYISANRASIDLLRKTETVTQLDQRAIKQLRRQWAPELVVQKTDAGWIAHGPIRATQKRCVECHEVKNGSLLGAFRFTFPLEYPPTTAPAGSHDSAPRVR